MIRPAVVTRAPTSRSVTPTRSRVVALMHANSARNAAYQQSQKPITPVIGTSRSKTSQVREWPSPGGKDSEPYAITSIGNVVWYSESGVRPNTMVRFDTQTEKFQTFASPSGGGVLRHFESTAQGSIVTANSGVNKIALVEIGTLPANRTN